jgi:uncharacterized repeat protein (TIGR03803 family)
MRPTRSIRSIRGFTVMFLRVLRLVQCERRSVCAPIEYCKILGILLLLAATAIAARAQTLTTLVNFDGTNGSTPLPAGSLTQGLDGGLYGTTKFGGANSAGTIFRMSPGGLLTTLYSFCAQSECFDGSNPNVGLVLGTDGNFYGTTYAGGASVGAGVIFKVTPHGRVTTLHRFAGYPTDGGNPSAALVQGSDGAFYGTTYGGGAFGSGTAFKITRAGTQTILHSFDTVDGALPGAALIQATDGNFYGTTQIGGANEDGTVFKITSQGELITLHSFDSTDGAQPVASLIQATNGKLYGTTMVGGNSSACLLGCGTVFRITRDGVFTSLNTFDMVDGAYPTAGLVQVASGSLDGTAIFGGSSDNCTTGCGTIFEINLATEELTVLHSFSFTDGGYPGGGLIEATNGTLYGTATVGGSSGDGTVFSLSTGLGSFVSLLPNSGRVGAKVAILGTNLTGATSVTFGGTSAAFTVVSGSQITTAVPVSAITGKVVVTNPKGALSSHLAFRVTN